MLNSERKKILEKKYIKTKKFSIGSLNDIRPVHINSKKYLI
jgi:hypothetical protein